MNRRTDVPGYGYQLAKGATALTESWQASPDASNNHLMLGHLMEWLYAELAGIREAPTSVAGKAWVIYPKLVGDIKRVAASYHSPYGLVESSWHRTGSQVNLRIKVPVNTTARVYVPASAASSVREGGKPVREKNNIQLVGEEAGYAVYEVGSGTYAFQSGKPNP